MDAHTTRKNDHDTSIEAATKVHKRNFTALRQQVHAVLKDHPEGLADFQIRRICAERYGPRSESTYRKRRTELVEMGLAAWSGERRMNDTGSREKVWVAAKGEG